MSIIASYLVPDANMTLEKTEMDRLCKKGNSSIKILIGKKLILEMELLNKYQPKGRGHGLPIVYHALLKLTG